MKNLKKFKIITAILMINILTNCASITANKVKLSDYPEVKKEEIENLNLSYESFKFEPDKKGYEFNSKVTSEIDKNLKVNNSSSCVIKFTTMHSAPFPRLCIANYFLAGVTLFTIPYYCQHIFEAKATLISTSNNKTLKEYYLKDKAHEVWSSLLLLAAIPITPLRNIQTPESANAQIEQTISEALTRQILNDAATFPECQKK